MRGPVTVPVVAAALLFWVCVFMVYFTAAGTTPREFFFGAYEPPPPDLGRWKQVAVDVATGWLREERCLLPNGNRSRCFVHQARYRDPSTRKIVRVEPEKRLPRRRVSVRS
jgi:hypothetical protein